MIDGETRLYYDDGRYYLIDDISTKYYSNISNPLNIFNNNMIYGRNGEFGLKIGQNILNGYGKGYGKIIICIKDILIQHQSK